MRETFIFKTNASLNPVLAELAELQRLAFVGAAVSIGAVSFRQPLATNEPLHLTRSVLVLTLRLQNTRAAGQNPPPSTDGKCAAYK